MVSREHHKVSRRVERVHSNFCELPGRSRQGSRYIMTFLDELMHYALVYFLKSKRDAFLAFKRPIACVERDTGEKLRSIHSDNRGEYTSNEWNNYCSDSGIRHSKVPPHPPQLNGVTERYKRTLLDCVLPSQLQANLSVKFWEDVMHHSVVVLNLSPT